MKYERKTSLLLLELSKKGFWYETNLQSITVLILSHIIVDSGGSIIIHDLILYLAFLHIILLLFFFNE